MIGKKRIVNRLFFLFLVVIISNCILVGETLYCAEKTSSERNTSIIFGVYSFMPEHKVTEKYAAFTDYLSATLNKEVKIEISSQSDQFLKKIGKGDFDLAFINAVNYTRLINTYGKKKIIAILSSNDNPYYFENIVVAKDSSYKKISDLNKKEVKFAFSIDESKSTIQEAILSKGGIEKQYLKNRNYYKPMFSYKEMVSAIKNKECDAGCMDDFLLNTYEENPLSSIAKSGPIPAPMIIANDALADEAIEELEKVIHSLHLQENGTSVISKINNAYNRFQLPENINFQYLQMILKKDIGEKETVKIGQGILPWEKNNGCPPFLLRDDEGQIINPIAGLNSEEPYSTRQTCGFCHDYQKISQGFHFQMGMNEREGFDNTKSPWKITPGMTGGW